MRVIAKLIHTVLSISGFIPEHMTVTRTVIMLASLFGSVVILPQHHSLEFAIGYFLTSTVAYIGLIFLTLPEKGLRLRLIKTLGEERAYLYYEAFLAFAFFHNGVALSFVSYSSMGSGLWGSFPKAIVIPVFLLLFSLGLTVKVWAAYVLGIPIYYWKDMFLQRQVGGFVTTGPYKYTDNAMYGVGQLQVYAIAFYYDSVYGLIVAAINQLLLFLFYFTVERPFINRAYLMQRD
jgi:protein-S-isoprenylcysteine O-methyltransferase Ste14